MSDDFREAIENFGRLGGLKLKFSKQTETYEIRDIFSEKNVNPSQMVTDQEARTVVANEVGEKGE